MADMFTVYDLLKRSKKIMSFATVCATYPWANLALLKESCVSVVTIYKEGKKVAVINRTKEANFHA